MDELINGPESPGAFMRELFFALQQAGHRPLVLSIAQLEKYSDDRDFDVCAVGNWRVIGRLLYEYTKNSSWILINIVKKKSGSLGFYFESKVGNCKLDIFRYVCHYGTSLIFFDTASTPQKIDGMATVSPEDEFLYKLIKGVCRRKEIPQRYYERFYDIIDRVDFDGPGLKPLVKCIGADDLDYVINEIRGRRKLSSQFTSKLTPRLARFRNRSVLLTVWLILRDKFVLYFHRLRMPEGIYIRIVIPDEKCWSDVSDNFLETMSHLFPRIRMLKKPDEKRKRTIYSRSEVDKSYNTTKEFILYRVKFLPLALIRLVEFCTFILPAKIRHVIVLEEGVPNRTGLANVLQMLLPKPDVVVIFRPAIADLREGTSMTRTESAGMEDGTKSAFELDIKYVEEPQSPKTMVDYAVERTLDYMQKRTLRRLGIPQLKRPRHRGALG